jgi:hypothetical protein
MPIMRSLMKLCPAWLLAALVAATPASAQMYGMGTGTMTLYASPYFSGGHRTYTVQTRSLAASGFKFVATSAIVASGVWQLCTSDNFNGRCVTLKAGRYPELARLGMDYRVASVRPVGHGNPPPGYGYSGPPPQQTAPAANIFIYDQPGLNGLARQLHGPVGNLESIGFGGRAMSASVIAGRWELCTGVGYRPPCQTVGPGRYERLAYPNGNIWSARPL